MLTYLTFFFTKIVCLIKFRNFFKKRFEMQIVKYLFILLPGDTFITYIRQCNTDKAKEEFTIKICTHTHTHTHTYAHTHSQTHTHCFLRLFRDLNKPSPSFNIFEMKDFFLGINEAQFTYHFSKLFLFTILTY